MATVAFSDTLVNDGTIRQGIRSSTELQTRPDSALFIASSGLRSLPSSLRLRSTQVQWNMTRPAYPTSLHALTDEFAADIRIWARHGELLAGAGQGRL